MDNRGTTFRAFAALTFVLFSIPGLAAGIEGGATLPDGLPNVPDMVDAVCRFYQNVVNCVALPQSEPFYDCILANLNHTVNRILDDL